MIGLGDGERGKAERERCPQLSQGKPGEFQPDPLVNRCQQQHGMQADHEGEQAVVERDDRPGIAGKPHEDGRPDKERIAEQEERHGVEA